MKTSPGISRRAFLRSSAGTTMTCIAARRLMLPDMASARESTAANERLHIGSIGMRYQGSVVAEKAQAHGDIVAICDVDREIAEKARDQFGGQADLYEDYRQMLQRSDIDVVTIGTPDHWHTAMVIDACRAGKDIYCEKPLTLTIDEGQRMAEVVHDTQRVLQVGSWQRSDHRFRLAVEMVRAGRIGQLERVDVVLGKNITGGPFQIEQPPAHLNWDLWQGQTPDVPYIKERCHYTFRWWYEYSGGQMTDWGAHHLDIAQWAIGAYPVEIEGAAKYPNIPHGYNVAIDFSAKYRYANGVEMTVSDTGRNGIMLNGSEGRIFVNRGVISGKPVEQLEQQPLAREAFNLYAHDNLARPPRKGKLDSIINHMGNFFDCVKSRQQPISDVDSQHRSVSTCHLGNIAMRLGRKLQWDPDHQRFVNDDEANQYLTRPRRSGFELNV
jgi:myo-inositol 2-dehydrogenase/D-chiro-inositol 1-dehydrogenase